MFGPGRALDPFGGHVAWEAWQGHSSPVDRFLAAYLVADVVFMVGVVGAVFSAVRSRWAVIAVALAVVVDAVEGLGAWFVLHARVEWLAGGLGFVTMVKWLLYASLIWIVGTRVWKPENRVQLLRIGYGLVRQRFSLLALLPIAALGIAPGSDLLDQFPDVERRWLDGGLGWVHQGAACATLLLLAAALFVLGRLRSDRIWRRATGEGPALATTPKPTLWIVVGVVVPVVALAVHALGGVINWRSVAVVVGIVVFVLGSSALLRHCGRHIGSAAWHYEEEDEWVARSVIGVGDTVAVLAMVIAGIGFVRAFTAPLVLDTSSSSQASGGLSSTAGPLVCVLIGLAAAVAAWPIAAVLLRQVDKLARRVRPRWWVEVITPGLPAPKDGQLPPRARTRTRLGLAVAGVGLLVALGTVPDWAAVWMGLIACLVLAVIGLVTVLGVVVVVSQERPAQQLFRWLGLRTTPLVTLMLIAAVVTWYRSGDAGLHGIRNLGQPTGRDTRPTLDAAFTEWMGASAACDSQVMVHTTDGSRPVRLRPMVLVAAEGGGIRAAYWTASAFERMTSGAQGYSCGRQAVFLSSGVSGGSLGLAVAATSDRPADAAGQLSAPDALSAAAIGLLVRDDIAALTGIHFPTLDRTDSRGWHDRAALMESIWEQQAPRLRQQFIGGGHQRTGNMIFNSTSVGTSCRVLVSQIQLDNTTPRAATRPLQFRDDPPCRSGAAVAPATFDLLTDYAYQPAADSGDQCVHQLSMATAAMLSARFTYITPSGVVGPATTSPSSNSSTAATPKAPGLAH